jgi:chemotaxis protein MotA
MLNQTVLFIMAQPALAHRFHDNPKIRLSGTAPSTFIGFLTGIALFVLAIILSLTDSSQAWIFLNGPSFVLVVGGTVAATFAGHESRYVWLALKGIVSTLLVQRIGRNLLNREVGRIIRWGYLVQQQGIPALEADAKNVRGDDFLNFGVEMVVSSYPGEGCSRDIVEYGNDDL